MTVPSKYAKIVFIKKVFSTNTKCTEVYDMSLLESGENYLETILILSKRNGSVRSIDRKSGV